MQNCIVNVLYLQVRQFKKCRQAQGINKTARSVERAVGFAGLASVRDVKFELRFIPPLQVVLLASGIQNEERITKHPIIAREDINVQFRSWQLFLHLNRSVDCEIRHRNSLLMALSESKSLPCPFTQKQFLQSALD